MSSIIYSECFPENVLEEYNEFQNVDFLLTFPSRALELNSIRITADCEVSADEKDLLDYQENQSLFYNSSTGGHGTIESVVVSIDGRVIESLNEYGRFCSMKNQAEVGMNEKLKGSLGCQGITVNNRTTNSLIRGSPSGAIQGGADPSTYKDGVAIEPFNFTIRPEICLNNAYAGDGRSPLLSSSKASEVKISLRLARNSAFLYGTNASDNVATYLLKNLKCSYITRDDMNPSQELFMRTKINIKQSLASDSVNVGAVVPAVCDAVSMSVQPQESENDYLYDNYQLHRIPQLNQLQFLFNDSTNQYLTFILKSQAESYERGIDSLRQTGSNQAQLQKLQSNNGAIYGLSFGQYVPLFNQKFNIQADTSIGSSGKPYILYLYFHSLLTM